MENIVEKKTIFFIIDSLKIGGAEKVITRLANHFSIFNNVFLISLNDEQSFYEISPNVKKIQFKIGHSKNIRERIILNFKRIYYLYLLYKKYKPNTVVSFLPNSNVLNILISLFFNNKIIIAERSNPYFDLSVSRVYLILRFILYRFSDVLVLQNKKFISYFRLYSLKKIVIVENSVQKPKRQCNYDKIDTICYSRLSKEKQIDQIIVAFKYIKSNSKLIIIGSGPEESNLKNLVLNLGLTDKVKFYGSITDYNNVVDLGGIYVLTSLYEGFPNSLCEMMSLGFSSVIYDINLDFTIDGYNCILENNGNIKEFAEDIDRLVLNKNERIYLGNNARVIIDELSDEKIFKKWEMLL